jgi:hypothetical protein
LARIRVGCSIVCGPVCKAGGESVDVELRCIFISALEAAKIPDFLKAGFLDLSQIRTYLWASFDNHF